MEENNLKLAQEDISEALRVVEDLERYLEEQPSPKQAIKERFLVLSEKVLELENILKSEGIL